MGAENLHPALQHHIVNSLGWRSLRPVQEAAIEPLIAGEDTLIVSPTAGGKTEAAALPLLSRMLSEEWTGLSVLYVSPLRALANNIEERLESFSQLVGRRAAAWHGDTAPSARKAMLREPPDLLITTPESLEVMLISLKVEHARLFRELQAVIVDEIHAFGADDRGWHLLSVLARIEHLVGRRLQRVGLSATVGNPEDLLHWLGMASGRSVPSKVVRGPVSERGAPDLRADFVGSLSNAATVIAGLHRGEKRLVFCDSRSNVEKLAAALRAQGIETFVSHSSLGRDERRRAESAFSQGSNCVIVATSTLELGIDVGDLDRVIQIDAPTSVASFLQRMGRTGRRLGAISNMLFLATRREYLLRAAGLALLWERGYVEQIHPPKQPLHIEAQQLLALCLQEGRVGSETWFDWIADAGLPAKDVLDPVVAFMRDRGFIEDDQEMLFIGEQAEQSFGAKHFMELVSVFTSPPLIEVRFGREQLGSVHESSFIVRNEAQPVLLLAGRSWALEEIDWKRRIAHVVPTTESGNSRWLGSGQPLNFELCRAMRDVICGDGSEMKLSERATAELNLIREELDWTQPEGTVLATEEGRTRWWTFAGNLANRELEWRLNDIGKTSRGADELSIAVAEGTTVDRLREALAVSPAGELPVDPDAVVQLKFSDCLPRITAEAVLRARARDENSVQTVMKEQINRVVRAS